MVFFQADDETAAVQVKTEPMDDMETVDSATSWSILRDDFMMGAKMKDWDRQTPDTDMPVNTDSDDDDNSTDNDEDSDYS